MAGKTSRWTRVIFGANCLGLPVVFPPLNETLCCMATCTVGTVSLEISSVGMHRTFPLIPSGPEVVGGINVRIVAVGAFDARGETFKRSPIRRISTHTGRPLGAFASRQSNQENEAGYQGDKND
jgi:hypothetical protein